MSALMVPSVRMARFEVRGEALGTWGHLSIELPGSEPVGSSKGATSGKYLPDLVGISTRS